MKPSVSVCIPNYNHARFLVEALGDALGQTEPPLEVLVVDDASMDESPLVLGEWAAREPTLQVDLRDRNAGVAAAMGRLLERARGDYLLLLAADDRVDPTLLAESTALLARHPGAGICTVLARIIDEAGRRTGELRSGAPLDDSGFLSPLQVSAELEHRGGSWMMSAGALWRRDALIEIGGFRPELGPFTDSIAALAVALRHGACFLPRTLASWRRMESGYATATAADPDALRRSVDAGVAFMQVELASELPASFAQRWAREQLLRPRLVEAEQRFLERRRRWRRAALRLPGPPIVARLSALIARAVMVIDVVAIRLRHGAGVVAGVAELWRARGT